MEKVILVSIDGMRPDGFLNCGNPFIEKMMSLGSYTLEGRTVFPSVTLPCHMSMFHSVPPERHGISTNLYMPMVRPLNGLFENVKRVYEAVGDEYTIVVTADHGGHERSHGSDLPEDMTIPMFFIGNRFEPGKQLTGVSILDLAPTIADVMSVTKAPEWEGKSVAK